MAVNVQADTTHPKRSNHMVMALSMAAALGIVGAFWALVFLTA